MSGSSSATLLMVMAGSIEMTSANGTASTTVNTTGSSLAWNNISDGKHSFAMRAVDSAGNWSPQSTFGLWIDTTPPVVSNVTVTPNPIPQGTVTVSLAATIIDAGSGLVPTTNPPQFQWCVSSNASRNWSAYAAMTPGANNQWTGTFSEPGNGQTLYYQIQTQDALGNSTVYPGSIAISGPSGNDGPLLPPVAMGVLLLLFFGLGNWLVHRRKMSYQQG